MKTDTKANYICALTKEDVENLKVYKAVQMYATFPMPAMWENKKAYELCKCIYENSKT